MKVQETQFQSIFIYLVAYKILYGEKPLCISFENLNGYNEKDGRDSFLSLMSINEQNPDGDIFGTWISDQFLVKENCHHFRTSDNIETKFRPVTKMDKRNKKH